VGSNHRRRAAARALHRRNRRQAPRVSGAHAANRGPTRPATAQQVIC
jgi:hypothetical protein